MAIKHSTAADGTFSTDGATAWDADHTLEDATVTLAKMADLAQDKFIVRTTASTGVPQTATVTAAARTVLDDTTVSAMVDTLGGAAAAGTGGIVRVTSPTLVTPVLGVAAATTINKITFTQPATGATVTIVDGKTLTASNTITFTATDGSTLAIGTGGTLGTAAYTASTAYDAAGAAAAVTPTTLGLVIGTNVQAYDAELTTWAGVTPGTGVATALAVNVGSAGAPVVNGGALGTPSSGVGTNLTGIPVSALVSGTLAENVDFALDAALSADGKYSGIVEAGTSSAALAFGEVCYRVTATGKWALAKADAAATSSLELGMCVLAAGGADAATTMLLFGKVRADTLFDTFTVGAPVYISAATAGKTVSAAPTGTVDFVQRKIGSAEDANTVFFKPDNSYTTIDASSTLKTVNAVALPAASGGVGNHEVLVNTGNGHGSTNTKIRRFTTAETEVGTAITYADSAGNGGSFTINETGIYAIHYRDSQSGANACGVSVNSAQLTTNIDDCTVANIVMFLQAANIAISRTLLLTAADVVRAHGSAAANATGAAYTSFSIRKVGTV